MMNSILRTCVRLSMVVAAALSIATHAAPLGSLGLRAGVASTEQVNGDLPMVSLSADVLLSALPGDLVRFALGNSMRAELVTERLILGGQDAVTWVGYDPLNGTTARTFITLVGDAVSGEIVTQQSRFEISRKPSDGGLLRVKDLAAAGMTRNISTRPDYLRVDPEARRRAKLALTEEPPSEQKAAPAPQATIDAAIFYTPGMVTRYGSVNGVIARINQLVAAANVAYANSEVAITLRLVRTEQVVYPEVGSNKDALGAFSGFQTEPIFGEINPLPALAATVRPIRNAVGADLMILLRPYSEATHFNCGTAWIGDGVGNVAFDSQFGYAVVSDSSDGNAYCPNDSFAHELGHNMGLVHDRPNAGFAGATSFSYGYGVNYNGNTANLGDIMSYAANRVPFFSSPNLRCNTVNNTCAIGGAGTPLGVAGDTDFGACTTNPSSCADGARTLNVMRAYIASFRAAVAVGVSISGTISNGAPLVGTTFCAQPSAGVSCTASSGTGAYSCTVPNGWNGMLHAPGPVGQRIKPQSFTNVTTNLVNQNPVVQAIGACNLDVDNNGLIEPTTDGVAILRRMLGVGASGYSGLSGTCAANTTSAAILGATTLSGYNVTGLSTVKMATDGAILVRAMRGLTGPAATNGLGLAGSSATRTDWATQLRNYINTTCGSDFQ